MKKEILRLVNVRIEIDQQVMFRHLNLSIYQGELISVFGPYHSGKSVLARVIAGKITPVRGQILFYGEVDAKQKTRHQITIVGPEPTLVENFSVFDNIVLQLNRKRNILVPKKRKLYSIIKSFFKDLEVGIDPSTKVYKLSKQQKYTVEIIRAAFLDYKIIIIDDISKYFDHRDYYEILNLIKKLPNIGFVYINNTPDIIMSQSSRVVVLRNLTIAGVIRKSNYSEEALLSMLYGEINVAHTTRYVNSKNQERKPIICNISTNGLCGTINNIAIHEGEVVSILDMFGSRWQHIRRLILDNQEARIKIDQTLVKNYYEMVKRGVCFVSHDYNDNIFPMLSFIDNASMSILKKISSLGIVNRRLLMFVKKQFNTATWTSEETDHLIRNPKFLLMKWIVTKPRLIILENILLGLDYSCLNSLSQIIHNASECGISFLIITTIPQECLAISDRVLVLQDAEMAYWISDNADKKTINN